MEKNPRRGRAAVRRRQLDVVVAGGRADREGLHLGCRPRCRFRNRGIDYISESGMKWTWDERWYKTADSLRKVCTTVP